MQIRLLYLLEQVSACFTMGSDLVVNGSSNVMLYRYSDGNEEDLTEVNCFLPTGETMADMPRAPLDFATGVAALASMPLLRRSFNVAFLYRANEAAKADADRVNANRKRLVANLLKPTKLAPFF